MESDPVPRVIASFGGSAVVRWRSGLNATGEEVPRFVTEPLIEALGGDAGAIIDAVFARYDEGDFGDGDAGRARYAIDQSPYIVGLLDHDLTFSPDYEVELPPGRVQRRRRRRAPQSSPELTLGPQTLALADEFYDRLGR